jgi:hypothetical protein
MYLVRINRWHVLILGEGGEEKIVPVMKENGTSSSLWFR